MSDKNDRDELARLERLNHELTDSLRRCRKLLHDFEARLAANSNQAEDPDGAEESRNA